jgi:hypothetical protein
MKYNSTTGNYEPLSWNEFQAQFAGAWLEKMDYPNAEVASICNMLHHDLGMAKNNSEACSIAYRAYIKKYGK